MAAQDPSWFPIPSGDNFHIASLRPTCSIGLVRCGSRTSRTAGEITNLCYAVMMKPIAIMPPQFLPFLGYFQLMHAAEKVYLIDDVEINDQGWILKNRMIEHGQPNSFELPLVSNQHQAITEHQIFEAENTFSHFRSRLHQAYAKAPQYAKLTKKLDTLCAPPSADLIEVLTHSISWCCAQLALEISCVRVSTRQFSTHKTLQQRIIALCEQQKATHYITLPSEHIQYDEALFKKHHLELLFLLPHLKRYPQLSPEFHPALSVIDLILNLDSQALQKQLQAYHCALPILQAV